VAGGRGQKRKVGIDDEKVDTVEEKRPTRVSKRL